MIADLRFLLVVGSVLLLLGCGSSTQQKESKWPNGKTREVWVEDGDGLRHGLANTHYENGKLQTQVTFYRDYPHGPFKMWDREGNVIADGEFKNGQKWNGRFIRGDMAVGRVNFETWENGVMTSAPIAPLPPRPPAQGPPPGGNTPPGASGTNQAVPVTDGPPAPPQPPPLSPIAPEEAVPPGPPTGGPLAPPPAPAEGVPPLPPPPPAPPAPPGPPALEQ